MEAPIRKLILITLFLSVFLTHDAIRQASGAYSAQTVKMKMIVANPSENEMRTVPVKIFLPKGISADEVINDGKFRIDYDFERALYSAFQEVVLEPKETVALEVEMTDIWVIPEDELTGL
ncbi:MAG: hypothetical protein NTY34_01980, partial [Candidatus Omnitrophica bacterium]|nr:hypothetical protein [Candidatus Omnitrophota bacterium]